MEFIQGGQLQSHIRKSGRFPEIYSKFYACQLIVTLQHIHRLGYVYRTLNPSNILIGLDGNISVVDYGKKKVHLSQEYYNNNLLELAYMAPEIINGREHGTSADFWSLGILIYEMLTGTLPFYNMDKQKMLDSLATRKIQLSNEFSVEARNLVDSLLE